MIDIATPHIAGYTLEGKANGTSMIVKAVSNFFNLELDDWKPDLPPKTTMLVIDCSSLSDLEVLQRVFKQVYPILNDDQNFRERPVKFENLRRNYNFRRANETFNLSLTGISEKLQKIIKELGFKLFELKINYSNK